jgi:uncharacterized membrane protein
MAPGNLDDPIFSATLVPHRSLGRGGFLVLMAIISGLCFATGVFFFMLGAWPVLGFVGLDFLAILVAFRLNYRSARAYEEIEVSRASLVVRKVAPGGRAHELRFNPRWVRLEVERGEDEGVTRVAVRVRDRCFPVGGFLNPRDRESFAGAFGSALAAARR